MATKNRYKAMSDEELRELSKQKVKSTGCFKRTALAAQKELWERHHWNTDNSATIDDGFIDRDIDDIQYNG